jgi:hypothetical protein
MAPPGPGVAQGEAWHENGKLLYGFYQEKASIVHTKQRRKWGIRQRLLVS